MSDVNTWKSRFKLNIFNVYGLIDIYNKQVMFFKFCDFNLKLKI